MRNETKSCEICGKPISGKPLRVKIEGSVFECVCSECSKLGKVQKPPAMARVRKTTNKPQNNQNRSRGGMSQRVYTRDDGPMDDIVEDYGVIVKQAREAKGLSREQLGQKIYEKVSVINRIESGKMEPDLKLAKKLEKTLNITLIEQYDEMDLDAFKSSSSGANTLGSIVKIKRK